MKQPDIRLAVSKEMKDVFNLAMKEWEDYTCLRFQEKQTLDTLFFMKYRTDNMGYVLH